jgi:hypothetical protein
MTTSLTLYGNQTASSTLATADQAVSTNTGTTTSAPTTLIGTSTGIGEIPANGSVAAWAGAGSLPAQSGKGWLYDTTSLEFQQFIAGNWQDLNRIKISVGTATADIIVRFSKYNAGVYTTLGTITLSAQSLTTTITQYTSAATAFGVFNFANAGDKLYIDRFANITTNGSGSGAATLNLQSCNNVGLGRANNAQLISPGFQPIPVLSTSPTSLSFSATAGGASPASQNSTLSETAGTGTAWTSSISYGSGSGWLAISPTSDTLLASGSEPISFTCTTGSLTAGTYTATVTFTASNGGKTATVGVTFVVNSPAPPSASVAPTTLNFAATAGSTNPASQNATLSNTGGTSSDWTMGIVYGSRNGWLSTSPTSGTLAGGANVPISFTCITAGLPPGTYTATVTYTFTTGGSTAVVTVTFVVSYPPGLSVLISGIPVVIKESSWKIQKQIDQQDRCVFTVEDSTGTASFFKGQSVVINDSSVSLFWTGYVNKPKALNLYPNAYRRWSIDCIDQIYLPNKRTSNKVYANQYSGTIFADQVQRYLTSEGVSGAFALRWDELQSDFAAGTLTNAVAATNFRDANSGDGDLELSPAGSDVSYSDLGIISSTTKCLKLQGTAVSGVVNNYVYREIWKGSQLIASGDSFEYDVFISSTSPQIIAGCDFVCTDGTTFRDSPDAGTDAQGILPHPKYDLAGLANDQWYHRGFGVSGALISKTIAFVTLVLEGDNPGTYTAFFRNIYWKNGATTKQTFSDDTSYTNAQVGSSPPTNVTIGLNGYSNVSLTIVQAYDNVIHSTITHSIDAAKIVKGSSISWVTGTAGGTAGVATGALATLETSIDNGASWQTAINGGAIPNLLPGMNVAGRSVQFRRSVLLGNDPTVANYFVSEKLTVYTSYNATKADVINTTSTQANFNAGTKTNTKSLAGGGVTLDGFTRNYDDTDYSSQTVFGGGGPTHAILNKQIYLQTNTGFDVRSRLDFAGNWQDFTAEVDIQVPPSGALASLVYRTTGWQNNDATYAYAAEVTVAAISLQRGTNSSTGAGSRTQIGTQVIALTANSWHRLKIVISGSNHKVYLDDILYLNVTDATYGAAGNLALRYSNATGSTASTLFDNFGVVTNLTGTWQSPSISIAGATTYGSSLVEWDTAQTPDGTFITAQTSINGGSTWQDITNGGSIANLTVGQSLAGVNLLLKFTLTANNAPIQPTLGAVTVWVLGQFSASGTRISPVLSLAGVGRAGSSLVNWNALQPTNTSVLVDTSIDNQSTWQNVATPGNPISGINLQPQPIYDTFASLANANYLSTFGNGGALATWSYDTAHSRIAASGGSDALYIRSDNRYAGLTIGINPGIGNAGSPYAFWTNLLADMAAQGLNTLRFQISWRNIELTQGNYTWTVLDDAVSHCNAAGIRIFYTIRDAPTWALDPANGAQLATSEPQYIMSPTLAAGFATQVATRYNGLNGHGVIDVIGFNEDFSIHFTPTGDTFTLNGTVTSGVPITSFPITASGFTPKAGTKIFFGTYTGPDVATVSTDVQVGDTTVHVNSFTPGSTYTATQVLKIGYVGIYNNPNYPGLYGAADAVTTINKTQPARDFHFAAPVYTAVYNAIRAVNPTIPIGLPAVWWVQGANPGGTPNTPVSNHAASLQTLYSAGVPMDSATFIDFHYYTNNVDPAAGNAQTNSISQVMTDFQTVAAANNDAGRQIICTEFGWQANQSTTSSTTIAAGTRTITLASTLGAAVGGTCLVDTVGSGVQETVTITGKTSTTITAVFANAHTATYPVVVNQDCDSATQATRYNTVMAAIQGAGANNQFLFYTLDYATSGTQTSSLVFWNGSSYTYQPAWTNIGTYLTAHPGGSSTNTATDVDMFVDMDQSDSGGMAWRYIDSNNFYELAIRDASSPTTPNTVQLFKYASGVKSSIGPTNPAISFTRGTYKRFRVTMLGGVITVYMDGVQVTTYTDGSPLGAGKCGLRNNTTSGASTARFYSFRMQAYGDDVSAKTLYVRQRLNSTDPTVTPAVLDVQAFVSSPAIGGGVLVPTADYRQTYVSNNLQDCNTKANYWWSIDQNKNAMCQPRNATPAPWVLQSTDVLVQGLTLENSGDLYRNRQVLKGVQATQVFSKNFTGDGSSTSWTLDYPIAAGTIPTIKLNNHAQSVGVQGVDAGKQFYYTPGGTGITQDSSGTLLQLNADTLAVSYTGAFTTSITRDNTNMAGTVTQSQMAAIDGSSGIVENVLDVTSMNLNMAAAQAYGDQLLQRYGAIGRTLYYRTLRTGVAPGQQQTAFVPEQACSDVQFLITSVEQTVTTGAGGVLQYWYTVIAMEGVNLGSWVRLFSSGLSK